VPSTLFSCIYRLFQFKLGDRQLRWMLDDPRCVYIRCAAILYIRFGLTAKDIWAYCREYLLVRCFVNELIF
jgi:pre-mRNA-splicing factor 38B